MRGSLWRKLLAVGFATLMFGAGCSRDNSLAEVEGTVRVNGRPLANIVVEFLPEPGQSTKSPRSTGVTDEAGHYRLRCEDQREGAVIGWHRVVLEDAALDRPEQGALVKNTARVAQRYSTAATTPLRREVKPGRQVIDLELSTP